MAGGGSVGKGGEKAVKKVAVITIHGMGRTEPSYHEELVERLESHVGELWRSVYVGSIFYQDVLQRNEDRVWSATRGLLGWSPWNVLRRFLLFGLADAAGLEAQKERPRSVYTEAQIRIAKAFYDARAALQGKGSVIVVAHSLGGQVLSNYLWDAGKWRCSRGGVSAGIWKDPAQFASRIAGKGTLKAEEWGFLAGGSLRLMFTTGCNIAIFAAACPEAIPIDRPNSEFEWHNFYDKEDVLGWPLATLSEKYARIVQDYEVNVGATIGGLLLRSWNPLSHGEYWRDGYVVSRLAAGVRAAILASDTRA